MPIHIKILAVGRRMPTWVTAGISDYKRRINDINLEIIEVPQIKRSTSQPVSKAIAQEGAKLLSLIEREAYIIALDQTGQQINSEQLADQLNQCIQNHQTLAFLIGGSDGLDLRCIEQSHARWSISCMTLPHALARLILVEQLYRAWTILNKHPYHR
ncbi:MAG: 23S rRNA (pseudouridine(1915)-N(3))-methyltransferase RlmH [Chromatiales bacterium]|nr:23S rRNA (pseudouridine(1915)-N(3))-methyltransferase RlmH [Chromatiales bacterium]